MSEQSWETKLEEFFQKGEWVRPDGTISNTKDDALLWNDYQAAKDFLQTHPGHYVYTLRDNEGGWIDKGYGFVNRLGYFISRIEVPLEDNDSIMYYPEDDEPDEEIVEAAEEELERLGYSDLEIDCSEEEDEGISLFFVAKNQANEPLMVRIRYIDGEVVSNPHWFRKYEIRAGWVEVKS